MALTKAEVMKRYWERHPKTAEDRRADVVRARKWALANPERVRKNKRAWKKRNPEKIRAYSATAESRAYQRAWRDRHLNECLLIQARHRAHKKGILFAITVDDIPPMGDRCPLLGYPFPPRGTRGRHPNAPSLDRIDPHFGYVPGNVWIVGKRANSIKSNATLEELEELALNLRRAIANREPLAEFWRVARSA